MLTPTPVSGDTVERFHDFLGNGKLVHLLHAGRLYQQEAEKLNSQMCQQLVEQFTGSKFGMVATRHGQPMIYAFNLRQGNGLMLVEELLLNEKRDIDIALNGILGCLLYFFKLEIPLGLPKDLESWVEKHQEITFF